MSTDKSCTAQVEIDGEQLENVSNFIYLGAQIESNGKSAPDIRRRLAIASNKLNKMMAIWKSEEVRLKMKILTSCIFPTAIYGCETWSITKESEKRITAFEMKCYRKILRIPWTAKESNANIMKTLGLKKSLLMSKIKKLKLNYFGHLKRHDTLERDVLEGMVEGKRGRGRPQRRWQQDIQEWLNNGVTECGRWAQDRDFFRRTVWEATSK